MLSNELTLTGTGFTGTKTDYVIKLIRSTPNDKKVVNCYPKTVAAT